VQEGDRIAPSQLSLSSRRRVQPRLQPTGRLKPESFDFPYAEEAFDFVFLTSVFTHMLPPTVSNYLSEIRRVIRPEGRCLMTFFILNEASLAAARAGRASRRFIHEGDGYFYDVPDRPEAATAHREEDLLRLIHAKAWHRPSKPPGCGSSAFIDLTR
jgi:SAM-dependent methyltransferase